MAEMDGKDIEWMKNQISDIGHDTDEILEDTHMNGHRDRICEENPETHRQGLTAYITE